MVLQQPKPLRLVDLSAVSQKSVPPYRASSAAACAATGDGPGGLFARPNHNEPCSNDNGTARRERGDRDAALLLLFDFDGAHVGHLLVRGEGDIVYDEAENAQYNQNDADRSHK